MDHSLDEARRWYAEDLRAIGPVIHNEAVVEAFARVPRERFCGPGPWQVFGHRRAAPAFATRDADPRHLYHDVLVVIDEARDLNNGRPSLWAYIFDQLSLAPGEHVLQVGVGAGYYTAVLADIVGPEGRVEAVELDEELATRAAENLAPWPQVSAVQGNGVAIQGSASFDVIVAFAGATYPPRAWLERLNPGGRLLVPLTGQNGWGFFLLVVNTGPGFAASSLGNCGFFPCEGARRPAEGQRLRQALAGLGNAAVPVRSLHLGSPPPQAKDLWFAGDDYWLSTRPPPEQ